MPDTALVNLEQLACPVLGYTHRFTFYNHFYDRFLYFLGYSFAMYRPDYSPFTFFLSAMNSTVKAASVFS